jgi:hypothetical protein
MKPIFKFLLSIVSVLLFATVFASAADVSLASMLIGMVAFGLIMTAVRFYVLVKNPDLLNARKANLALGVFTEIWDQVLAENLFRKYDWIRKARDRSGNVLNNAVVHIPQAGAVPNWYRNRQNFPVNLVNRVDSDITYAIDVLSSDAVRISDAEKSELNYDKIANILQDMMNSGGQKAAQNILYRWFGQNVGMATLNSANIIRTSGASTAGLNLPGATGNRNKFQVADVASAKQQLIVQTKQEINDGRRAIIMDETMYTQLKGDSVLTTLYNLPVVGAQFSNNGDLVRIHGFDIIRTDVLPRFTNAGTPLAKDPLDVTVTNAATDNNCALLVDFDKVHVALGSMKPFSNQNDALMQGDYYSALVRVGASRERFDQAGVIAIVQQ